MFMVYSCDIADINFWGIESIGLFIQLLSAFMHVDVAETTCWNSRWASGRKWTEVTLKGRNAVVGARQSAGPSISQTTADLPGFSPNRNCFRAYRRSRKLQLCEEECLAVENGQTGKATEKGNSHSNKCWSVATLLGSQSECWIDLYGAFQHFHGTPKRLTKAHSPIHSHIYSSMGGCCHASN